MRQRQPVPIMAVRRYLRTFEEPYKFLTQMERALGIRDSNYRNLRRAIADYRNLNDKVKTQATNKLLQLLKSKLPGTDLHRQIQNLAR